MHTRTAKNQVQYDNDVMAFSWISTLSAYSQEHLYLNVVSFDGYCFQLLLSWMPSSFCTLCQFRKSYTQKTTKFYTPTSALKVKHTSEKKSLFKEIM